MAVKQIQLRGISRTPSDRMTRDGGLAESLNMQLDGEELAPMQIPTNETSELMNGYPFVNGMKVVYIHQGNGFTNYIEESQGGVGALIHGKQTSQGLVQDDSVKDIQSMGNALIIHTVGGDLHTFIYKDGDYIRLDLGSLDLGAEFRVLRASLASNVAWFEPTDPGVTSASEALVYNYNTVAWNAFLNTPETSLGDDERKGLALIREYQESVWALYEQLREEARVMYGAFVNPVLACYAVRLFDGSYGFVSAPVLLGAIEDCTMKVYTSQAASNHRYMVATPYPWLCRLKFGSTFPTNWKDYIASVDIFLSEDIQYPTAGANIVAAGATKLDFEGEQTDKKDAAAKAALLSATNFYRIASLSVEDIEGLGVSRTYDLLTEKMNGRQDYRVTQPRLAEDTRYGLVPDSLMTYNGRLLALGDTYELKANYGAMFGPAGEAYMHTISDYTPYKKEYLIRFFINKNGIEYTADVAGGDAVGSISTSHGWTALFFPDPACYKAELIENSSGNTLYTVKMQEHPSLNCSYGYLGLGVNLIDLVPVTQSDFSSEAGSVVAEHNKLSMTRTDNPFVYELGNTQTFDDDIIGAATIAKALIASPYGLADIYVFTKGGIFSIQLMADGSFGSIHPYTRDVALPGTIVMIDHAVVFTTEKGVMLLSESGLQDISQTMRGRHEALPDSVVSLLAHDADFAPLLPAAEDSTPFMAFMKGARAAFDYEGNRLLFFNDAYKYQYVFMLNSLTWHKTDMVAADFYTILNSHPRCLVGTMTPAKTWLVLEDITNYPDDAERVARIIAANAPTSAGLVWQDIYSDLIVKGTPWVCDATGWPQANLDHIDDEINRVDIGQVVFEDRDASSSIADLSTVLDDEDYITETGHVVKGLVATRPLAFDAPDIRKVLKDIRIRTQANKGDVKYVLLASMDGHAWTRLTSKGGGSFKWFRLVLLTSLAPVERIGWLDVDVETRYTNKLR